MPSNENGQRQRTQDVTLILKDLLKVIKVVSMYPEGNPLPQSMKRSFAERLEAIVENFGDVEIRVYRDHLTLDDETVFTDRSKEESLAGLFFETGITKFAFKQGLDVEEIHRLLDALKTYVNSPARSQDLVNLIWEAGVSGFTFTTVEDIALAEYDGDFSVAEFVAPRSVSDIGGTQMAADAAESYNAIFNLSDSGGDVDVRESDTGRPWAGTAGQPSSAGPHDYPDVGSGRIQETVLDFDGIDSSTYRTAEAAEAMGLSDLQPSAAPMTLDASLILNDELRLSEEEEEQVHRMVSEDAQFDPYGSTAELAKELLHQETELTDFSETVTVCEKVLNEFIQAGRLLNAGRLLDYFRTLEEQIRKSKPLWAERLKDARITSGSRDRLRILGESLNRHPDIPAADFRRYLNQFDWHALAGLTDVMADLDHEQHSRALSDFLVERGRENTQIVSKGLFDKRWHVVRNSVIVMCRIGERQAINYLKQVVDHQDRRVRLALVQSLRDCPDDDALEILKYTARDRDSEIRKEAINSIVARRGAVAFDAITDILNDDSFAQLDADDRQAVLNAFSILGGDQAVEYLTNLILKTNLFRSRDLAFYRRAAFQALSFNRSERGEKTLLKLASSWRSDIRTQAAEALRMRRELVYGEPDDRRGD